MAIAGFREHPSRQVRVRFRVQSPAASRALRIALGGALVAVTLFSGIGCHSGMSPWTTFRMAKDRTIVEPITPEEIQATREKVETTTDRDRLTSRWMNGARDGVQGVRRGVIGAFRKSAPPSPLKEAPNPNADAELAEAEALFRAGDLAKAETVFERIARRRKDSSWGEKAQYSLAETAFQRGAYKEAVDHFDELIKVYPGTKYLDKAMAREFAVGHYWLALGEPQTDPNAPNANPDPDASKPKTNTANAGKRDDSVALTSGSTTNTEDLTASANASIKSAFQEIPLGEVRIADRFRGKVPFIDTSGSGVQILEKIRHYDPTGPLADKAVYRIAYHFRLIGDYDSASMYYDQLISDHPKSPLLAEAYLASIDSKLNAYVGPEYEGAGLEKSKDQIKHALTLFPDKPELTKKLYQSLDQIKEQEAERIYVQALFYKRLGKVTSAEYLLGMIPRRWPQSTFAAKARGEMAQLARMPRTETMPSKIMSQPGAPDPFSNSNSNSGSGGGPGGGMMGGMGAPF